MSDAQQLDVVELVEDDKNKSNVKCMHCDSLMLKPATADYVENEFDLPEPRQKKNQTAPFTCEKFKHFWVVNDMFIFENIAFSHTVDNTKYLICADCEIGPVGYFDLKTKRCYIALERVKHTA